jgi:hypothetical protein
MKRALLLLATTVIASLLAVGIASADPVNSPNGATFTLNCGGEEVAFVTIGHNNAPMLNVGESTSTFHITELIFTYTDLDTGDVDTETLATGQGNQTGLQDELTTCSQPSATAVDEETGHTIQLDATAVGFFTPLAG